MNKAENRKEEKFISLYQAFVDDIYRYIFLRTGLDTTLAEDMTQEIFLNVFKGMDEFKGLCSNRTWVFRIAKNRLFDFYRKQYRQKIEFADIDDPLTEGLSDPEQDTEKLMESALESQMVCDCLNNIPGHYRITLMMKYVDGKSVKQIAELTDKSPKAIESLLHRSKNAFIKEYRLLRKKEGFEL
ncbi:RNA polymerase sigma factor [Ruminiclostridium cellulolyticum]|uniref:RNA polymerase, sigma-24 subunit, ECF subfamily n=1 Tax=Ruminiclostridium cellulolyticum (strain ATCC 35319 / DSM 5812 / JCM 6584 / H10) TaxID=394503 RepID=B8I8R0_RUMCH|nr:RNA polymerase sigma factor [Ruminiclostridium cellulolyticum]ACL75293.1 RNA polymerase, sigma-24 subunit, ECF subfamily [Ruminiclostridium cellulolyticum H10]